MTRHPQRWFAPLALVPAVFLAACSDAPAEPAREGSEEAEGQQGPQGSSVETAGGGRGAAGTPHPSAAGAANGSGAPTPGGASPEPPPDVAECVARIAAGTPAELAALLRDLGYTNATDDACRAAHAVRTADAEACAALSTASLRRGCRVRVAARSGNAAACPRDHRGERDPTCLAWADRAPARCSAVAGHTASFEAQRCRAVLFGEAERCREMGELRAGCEHDVATMSGWLSEHDDRDLPPIEFEWSASVRTPGAREPVSATLLFDVSRGARIVYREDCVAWLVFDGARLPVLASAGLSAAVDQLAIRVPDGRRGRVDASGLRIRIVTDDARTFDGAASDAIVTGEARVLRLASQRGGAFSVEVDAQVRLPTATLSLRGTARAFLRDVEPFGAGCEGSIETEPRQGNTSTNP